MKVVRELSTLLLFGALAAGGPLPAAAVPPTASQTEAPFSDGEAGAHDTGGAAVEGIVRGRTGADLRPLPGAVVELRAPGAARSVLADAGGRYRIDGAPPGEGRILVHSIGYASAEVVVRVPSRGALSLDVELEVRPVALAPLQVEATAPPEAAPGPVRRSSAGLRRAIALQGAEATSGVVEAGLAAALGELGRGPGEEPTSALLLRGASTEGRLVLLDGSPVYAPFHVGGLVSGFDRDLLGGAELHVGGAPSRYDGGLSYILDLRTRSPRGDRLRSSGAVDGLGVRGVIEGPLVPGTRVLMGGRGLHGLQPRLLDGTSAPYGYGDVLLRADTELGRGQGLTTTAFRNRESVRLDGIGEAAPTWAAGEPAPSTARWGSGTVISRYRGLWGGTGVEIGGALSEYEARLPFRLSEPYLASARQERVRGTVDLGRVWEEDGTFRFGISVERQAVGYRVSPLEAEGGDDPLTGAVDAWVAGSYAEASRPLGDELQARVGLRADHFSAEGGVRLAPRLSLTWFLSESASLTLAGGRFHQYQTTTGIGSEAELLHRSRLAAWSPELLVSTANHLVVSLDQEVTPAARLEIDGFLKRFDTPQPAGAEGRIHTSGLELRVHREGDRMDVWAGYGLTWVWSQRGLEPASEFVGRQLLNAGFDGRLTERTHLGLALSYGAGLPVSSIPMEVTAGPVSRTVNGVVEGQSSAVNRFLGSEAEGSPLLSGGVPDDFLRLDLEMDWRTTWRLGGRETSLRPYLRVLNALNRRDALFHLFDPWRSDEVRPIAERPLIPVFGLEWRF